MFALGHQESDFQSLFYAFECKKDVPPNGTKIVTGKRQNALSEPIGWSLLHSPNGQFSLTGRHVWYRQDLNTMKSCENRDISV